MAEREAGSGAGGGGEAEARAQLERLDSLLSRMQALRSKYAEAMAVAPREAGTASSEGSEGSEDSEWKRRYVRAMEAAHAPGGKPPAPVRNRTDPIVPGSPGFRRDAD